jgi:hypothetical protein
MQFERYGAVGSKGFNLGHKVYVFLFSGAAHPSRPGPPITEYSRSHSHTTHSVGLLWTSDKPEVKTFAWQHTALIKDKRPCPGGVRSHKPSKQAVADPRLWPRGYTVYQTVTNKYKLGPLCFIKHWCRYHVLHIASDTEFCKMVSNICGSSVLNLLHVTSLATIKFAVAPVFLDDLCTTAIEAYTQEELKLRVLLT